jgi:uncharacterized protein with PIN domain
MSQATFRFYEELNDFLPEDKRKKDLSVSFHQQSTVRDVLVSQGVPHTAVDLILVDGESANLSFILEGGERVSVYPVFESFDIRPIRNLGSTPLRRLRFVADTHLGGLAKYLRLFGFDTLYYKDKSPGDLIQISVRQSRVLLTRSKGLLSHKSVTRGILVKDADPRAQLKATFRHLDLYGEARPFSRCLRCNGIIESVSKKGVAQSLPPRVHSGHQVFFLCSSCDRIYWQGAHFKRMGRFVEEVLKG